MTLKERIRSGAAFHMGYVSLDLTATELAKQAAGQDWDLLLVDLQHLPYTEPQLVEFCRVAAGQGLPVMVRIQHPDALWGVSRCLDFGAIGILVPMAEDPAHVAEAIRNFYYPPKGNRSCGLRYAYGYRTGMDPRRYADWDLLLVDLQHLPYTEPQLVEFCRVAAGQGLPVMVRIQHPDALWGISRCLDFGAIGILVPMAEDPAHVAEAIRNFYYPPKGNRSCGLRYAYGYRTGMDPRRYADWWNETGILALQIETVKGVRNVRHLVQPGVDLLLFGGCDLGFSIAATPDSPFDSVEEAQACVVARTQDMDVRVGVANVPFGRFEAVERRTSG